MRRKVSINMPEKSSPKVSIRQIKAARALLDWPQETLASAANVSIPTIKRLEAHDGPLGGRIDTGDRIKSALEKAGIEFIDEDGGGPGVRVRKQIHKKPSKSGPRPFRPQHCGSLPSPYYLYTVPIKAIHVRMARAAVGWGVRELAEKAGVTANTVTRIENGADAKQSTLDSLQRALEAAGVEFTNGEQPGVRLSKAAAAHSAGPASASNPTLSAKAARRRSAKPTEKKR
jgi:transcriptional regulator with XRE-family HTH domain